MKFLSAIITKAQFVACHPGVDPSSLQKGSLAGLYHQM